MRRLCYWRGRIEKGSNQHEEGDSYWCLDVRGARHGAFGTAHGLDGWLRKEVNP